MKNVIKYLKNNKDGSNSFGSLLINECNLINIKVIDKEKQLISYNNFICRVQSMHWQLREKLGLSLT